MSDQFGYNQQFTDKPGMWDIDGYAVCVDGIGTLQVQVNRVSTQGKLVAVLQTAPSSAISSITETGSGSGVYNIFLNQTWVELDMAHVETVCPTILSPALVLAQVSETTVGMTGFGPGQSALQSVTFATVSPTTGDSVVLAEGAGIFFHLRLQNTST